MATISRGGILQVKVTDPGRQLLSDGSNVTGARYLGKPETVATPSYTSTVYDKTGSGAIFEIDTAPTATLQDGKITIVDPGRNYKVGDVFECSSVSFGGQLYGYFEVTAVKESKTGYTPPDSPTAGGTMKDLFQPSRVDPQYQDLDPHYSNYTLLKGKGLAIPLDVKQGWQGFDQFNIKFPVGINLSGYVLTATISKVAYGAPSGFGLKQNGEVKFKFGEQPWGEQDRRRLLIYQNDSPAGKGKLHLPTKGGQGFLNFYLHKEGDTNDRFNDFDVTLRLFRVNRQTALKQDPGVVVAQNVTTTTGTASGSTGVRSGGSGDDGGTDIKDIAVGIAAGAAALSAFKGALGGADACGPAEGLMGLADAIDIIDDKIDELIEESPLGKLNQMKQEAEAAINGALDAVQILIPEIGLGIVDGLIPEELKGLQDAVEDIAGMVLAGAAALPALEQQLEYMKDRFADVDLGDFDSLDDVVTALRNGSLEISKICEMIPNFMPDAGGVGFTLKGIPTKFPEIDPVAFLKSGKLPDFPEFELDLDIEAITKEATDDFIQFDVPKIRI